MPGTLIEQVKNFLLVADAGLSHIHDFPPHVTHQDCVGSHGRLSYILHLPLDKHK